MVSTDTSEEDEWAEILQICRDVTESAETSSRSAADVIDDADDACDTNDADDAEDADDANNADDARPATFAGVSLHVDVSQYRADLRKAVESAEGAFLPGAEIDQCIASFGQAIADMKSIEKALDSLIVALEEPYTRMTRAAEDMETTRERHDSVTADHSLITSFVEQVQIPDDLPNAIETANTHSAEFSDALSVLSQKIAFTRLAANKESMACREAQKVLRALENTALERIQQRLEMSLQLLRDPDSSFEIVRDTLLLKQRHLIEFATDHERSMANYVLSEYVNLASATVVYNIRLYCWLYASRHDRAEKQQNSFDITSLARGTSGLLSSVVSEIFTEDAKREISSPEEDGPTTFANDALQDGFLKGSLRCRQALERTSKAALSEAEITLLGNEFSPSLDEVFHNCTAYFLSKVATETAFLDQAFGEGTSDSIQAAIAECQTLLLSLLQSEMHHIRNEPKFIGSLLLTILVNRAHRERIETSGERDPRIAYLVEAEKVVHTQLLADLDTRIVSAGRMPHFFSKSDADNSRYVLLVAQKVEFLGDVLGVAMNGMETVEAADIMASLQRRLNSFVTEITQRVLSFKFGGDAVRKARAYLVSFSLLLTAMHASQGTNAWHEVLKRLRDPVVACFDEAKDEYGNHVVWMHAQELVDLENKIGSQSIDVTRMQLDRFRSNWEERLDAISKTYSFLTAAGVNNCYHGIARRAALAAVVQKTERIVELVQEHCPTAAHLVVPRVALAHEISRLELG